MLRLRLEKGFKNVLSGFMSKMRPRRKSRGAYGNTFGAGSSGCLAVCGRRAVRSSGHVVLLFTPPREE